MKSAVLCALATAVFALPSPGQSSEVRADLSAGVARLYHSTGLVLGGALMIPLTATGSVASRIGPDVQFAYANVASTGQHRSLLGAGVRYSADLLANGAVSPVLGISARYTRASVSNIPTVGLGPQVPPEDVTATHYTGWSIGPEGGVRIRTRRLATMSLIGFVEHQSIYRNASTSTAWGLLLRVGFGL